MQYCGAKSEWVMIMTNGHFPKFLRMMTMNRGLGMGLERMYTNYDFYDFGEALRFFES